ncbi:CHAT domain-containing protein [Streptomyces albidoflavus]|uniref:CHAT domain-containing protein n=1 Tax=Streptomyces albidoflavus TaxID=1886 RepID=UPI0033BAD566
MRHDSVSARHLAAVELLQQYLTTGERAPLEQAEPLLREVLPHVVAEARPGILQNLAAIALLRRRLGGDRSHAEEAVALMRAALDEAPDDPELAAMCLATLADALYHHGGMRELDESVGTYRRLLTAADRPARPEELAGAAEVLRARHRARGDRADLAEALELYGRAASLVPPTDPRRPEWLLTRAEGLDHQDADGTNGSRGPGERVAAWRDALAAHPDPDSRHALALAGLGAALLARYEEARAAQDLEEAVMVLERACHRTPPEADEAVGRAVSLADAVIARATRLGRTGGLDSVLLLLDTVVAHRPEQDWGRAALLATAGQVCRTRFGLDEDPAFLQLAVRRGREALAAVAGDRTNLVPALGGLAAALRLRHGLDRERADLDEAIDLLQQAWTVSGESHRVPTAVALAGCLLDRAEGTRHAADARAALEVLTLVPAAPSRGVPPELLHSLGNTLMSVYHRTGELDLLGRAGQAFGAMRDALPPGHPDQPVAAASLAVVLEHTHRRTGSREALDHAVGYHRRALAQCPGGPSARRPYVDGLAYALRKRYDALADRADLHESIELLEEALAAFPTGHPAQTATRVSLVQALRAEHQHTGEASLLRRAAEVAAGAAGVRAVPVHRRVEAHALHGHALAGLADWRGAADALAEAVALLPRLASRDRLRVDQHHDLAGTSGAATSAAACALLAGQPERALELLEQGRGVLLGRRTVPGAGLAALRRTDPEAARAYLRLRREADAPEPPAHAHSLTARDTARDREAEWDRLIAHIRSLPGLADFLRPARAAELLAAVGDEPVVLVVPTRYRSDALILRRGRLDVLPLPRLDFEEAAANATLLAEAVRRAHDPRARVRDRLAAQETVRDLLDWLWRTTAGPVLHRLGHGPHREGRPWPRLWWCPTGPMAFLPLHAAQSSDGEGVLDRVVSSYTPTVEALLRTRSGPAAPSGAVRSCVVAMARTPGGHPDLPAADAEAEIAAAALPGARVTAGALATRERVLAGLAAADHAHIVCHAVADGEDPAESRLLVHDHADRPLTVADLSALALDHAGLAFLSACSTTRSSPGLADEAVHITGAFQLAGYRHVVGTLWEVDDAASLEIVRHFYATCAVEGPAASLHEAVRELRRRYPLTPTLWAAHLHTGP